MGELWGFFRQLAESDLKERNVVQPWTMRADERELVNARAVDLVNREVDWRPTQTHK